MMNKSSKGTFTGFLTGGDLVFHQLQLFMSNALRLLLVGVAIFSFVSWALISTFVSKYEWYVFYKSVYAGFWKLVHLPNYRINFVKPNGEAVPNVTSAAVSKFIEENPDLAGHYQYVAWCMSIAFLISIALIFFVSLLYIRIGKKAHDNEFLRGQKLVEEANLKELVSNPSPIMIGSVPIPADLLARNILLVGSMGTGKSQGINPMIEAARKWGKKMVIYDKTGEFTQKFYRPGIDMILNPVDARCADWSIFADLIKTTDAAMVSRFFVPENKNSADPVWDNSARMLLEDVISIVYHSGGTMAKVREIITQYSLPDLHKLLVQSGAASVGVINPENARSSESVRMTLTAQPAIRFFEFFNKTSASFSVREFVRREDDACLFLVSNSLQHEAVKPFISTWIELALAEVMSMPPTTETRLMFFLDELASLPKIKALDIAFTEARKYGIVSVVGIQNLSQLDDIYGEDMTRVYVANLQNKLILRTEEESSAKRLSGTLGKEDVNEVNESKSFGIESSRDGVSLGEKRSELDLVTYTEIMVLPDLTGYLKLAGDYPIAKVKLSYKARKDISEGFVERDGMNLVKTAPMVIDNPEIEIAEDLEVEVIQPESDKVEVNSVPSSSSKDEPFSGGVF